jgi:hypothetical protein
MSIDAAMLTKAMEKLTADLTEILLDNQRALLADIETKNSNLTAQLQLLLNKSDSGGGSAEKKLPKRVVATTTVANTTVEFPNMVGFSDANIKAINSLNERRTRNVYIKKRCAVDEAYYATIPESFRSEHENATSAPAEKAKKAGAETLREFVASKWWDSRKSDKSFLVEITKEMGEWIEFMHATTPAAPVAAMDNE